MSDHPEPRHKLTVKIGDALRTIQGYTMEEFKLARAEAYDDLKEDLDLVQAAKAVGAAGAVVNVSPTPAPVTPGVPSFAPPADAAFPPSCQHGPRNPVSKVGSKGPWKAWMCPQDKRTGPQCDPIWVQRGTAEWSSFPA